MSAVVVKWGAIPYNSQWYVRAEAFEGNRLLRRKGVDRRKEPDTYLVTALVPHPELLADTVARMSADMQRMLPKGLGQ